MVRKISDFFMDILEQISSPAEVVENLDVVLPKLINEHTLLENDCCNSYFLQIITTLLRDVLVELKLDVVEKRLLCLVLPCVSKIFVQSLISVCDSLESEENEDEISVTVIQFLQVCLDILSGYNYTLEYITIQKEEIQLDYIASLHKTLPNILLQSFTHCKNSESNYGPYFVVCTDILTTLFRKSYEVYLKYFRALEDKLHFSCCFEEDIELLNEVLDKTVTITEIVTDLDIKTSAEQWKSYLKVNGKYADKIKDRLNLIPPLSLLLSNIKQIINTVTNDEEVVDDKTRIRQLKLGSFILKIFIKLCELYKGFLDDCLAQILEMLLLLYSCSKNCDNNLLINQELDSYICIGGAALLNQFLEDECFFRELQNLYIRRKELSYNQIGLFHLVLVIMKKSVVSQSKLMDDLSTKYPFIEMVITLYNEVGLRLDMNYLLEGKDIYLNTVSVVMAFILSTVTASTYGQTEKLLFENLFSINSHTSLLVSDIICLIARFTNESICLEMVQYLSETLISCQGFLNTHRPDYVVASATLVRLSKLLTDKSSFDIKDKYCQNYANHTSYLLARGFCEKKSVTILAVPDVDTMEADYNVFVNKLKISGLKKYIEDKEEPLKVFKMLIAGFSCIIKENNNSELGSSWNQYLVVQILKIMPNYLTSLNNTHILQFLSGINDAMKHGNTSLRIAAAHCLRNCAPIKLLSSSDKKDVLTKVADIYVELLSDKDPLVRQEALESYFHIISDGDQEEIITRTLNQDNNIQELITLFQRKKTIQAKQRCLMLPNNQRFYHRCLKKIQLVDDTLYPPSKKLKQNAEDEGYLQRCFGNVLQELKLVKDYLKFHEFPEHSKVLLHEVSNEIDEIKDTVFNDEMIEEYG